MDHQISIDMVALKVVYDKTTEIRSRNPIIFWVEVLRANFTIKFDVKPQHSNNSVHFELK